MLQRIFSFFLIFISLAKLECKNDEIICYPKNGLGNILSCLVSSAVMAEEENREFQVYWHDILYEWKDLFVSPKLNFITKLPKRAYFNGRVRGLQGDWTKLSSFANKENKSSHDIMDNKSGFIYLNPRLEINIPQNTPIIFSTISDFKSTEMTNDAFRAKKFAFYERLVPVPYIRKRIANIYKTKFTSKTIGVHFRSTDMLRAKWGDAPPAYNKFAKEMQKELLNDPEVDFFLAADQIHAYNFFKSKFKKKVFFYDGHDFNEQGEVVRNTIKSQKDALVDLFLLSKTQKIIGTLHSSFGKVASEIGNIPIKRVDH